MKPPFVLAILAAVLIGCQSSAATAVPIDQQEVELQAAAPLPVDSAATFDAELTPTPAPTVAPPTPPAPAAIPTPAFPEGGFADDAEFHQWIQEMPTALTCTDDATGLRDGAEWVCFSRTDDFPAVADALLQAFPGEQITIETVFPMTAAIGEPALIHCYPPNRHSPAGSCTLDGGSAYGTQKYRPAEQ